MKQRKLILAGVLLLVFVPLAKGIEITPQGFILDSNSRQFSINGNPGNSFLESPLGITISINTPDTLSIPSKIEFLDPHGVILSERRVRGFSNPKLSQNGRYLIFREAGSITSIDLITFEEHHVPGAYLFDVSNNGQIASISHDRPFKLAIYAPPFSSVLFETLLSQTQGLPPLGLKWFNPKKLLLLFRDRVSIWHYGSIEAKTYYQSKMGQCLRDLEFSNGNILIGCREQMDGMIRGSLTVLDFDGKVIESQSSLWEPLPHDLPKTKTTRGIPWPLHPDAQHIIGNTYGEYQNYGGSSYPHPGVDILGNDNQPVYAVADGIVKAILTTSGEWHWRVAIGDEDTPGVSDGYLYAHLDEYSINVDVGDNVTQGQYLGNLVPWPIYDFTHIHFARIQESGTTWSGYWLCTQNPHLRFNVISDPEPPFFAPAKGNDIFAFTSNQTSSYQDPISLHGEIDIIARIGEEVADSGWICTVQEIRYSVYPSGEPENPIVDNKLSINFDMDLDTYQSGTHDNLLLDIIYKQDTTCRTRGDYDYRDFYHIVTNSNGDQLYEEADKGESWDTTSLPDGEYVIEVNAIDVAGNSTIQTMLVTTNNGNTETPTPTLTPTTIPSATPVITPTPAESPTPLPSATPPSLGVRIDLPHWGIPGELFWVTGYLNNPDSALTGIPVVFILDIHSEMWFWPDWIHYSPPELTNIDFEMMDIPPGETVLNIVPGFTWPEPGPDPMDGLFFHGALLDPEMSHILGKMTSVEWGYGQKY